MKRRKRMPPRNPRTGRFLRRKGAKRRRRSR